MLGGTPKLDPDLTPPPSDVMNMLRNDSEEEKKDVKNYKQLAELAESEELFSLKLNMEIKRQRRMSTVRRCEG